MNRRNFITLSVAAAAMTAAGTAAKASDYAEDVIAQLTRQGYGGIEVETTWLGRVRILARRDGALRDIVLNPRTGEILRDTFTAASGDAVTRPIIDDVDDGSGKDDGDGDDDSGGGSDSGGSDSGGSGGDDDNSGSGSGNSGGDDDDDAEDRDEDKDEDDDKDDDEDDDNSGKDESDDDDDDSGKDD